MPSIQATCVSWVGHSGNLSEPVGLVGPLTLVIQAIHSAQVIQATHLNWSAIQASYLNSSLILVGLVSYSAHFYLFSWFSQLTHASQATYLSYSTQLFKLA